MKNLKLFVIQKPFVQRKQHFPKNTKVNTSKSIFFYFVSNVIWVRYSIKLSNPINKYIGEDVCIVEPNPDQPRSYFIYLKNDEKSLFGQLFYQFCGYNNYLYTIIIGKKLYQVRSSDLKDRRLTIIDIVQSNHSSTIDCAQTLFQVIDSFSKANKKYHVTINDKKCQYGYLAIVILLDLHECQRNISS
jgi:hypothetical protein